MIANSSTNVTLTALQQAYHASLDLERLSGTERDRGVRAMAKAIAHSFDEILEVILYDMVYSLVFGDDIFSERASTLFLGDAIK